jgi:hypothetical protein
MTVSCSIGEFKLLSWNYRYGDARHWFGIHPQKAEESTKMTQQGFETDKS